MPKEEEKQFTPITSQEELETVLAGRLDRERRKLSEKYSDYEDNKRKAAQFDQLEEANKSALERAQEEIQRAKKERDDALVEGTRYKVAAKYGISEEDAALLLNGSSEEVLVQQAERLAARQPKEEDKEGSTKPGPRPDLTQGHSSSGGAGDPSSDFASFLSQSLK